MRVTTKKGAINGTHHDSGTILLFSAPGTRRSSLRVVMSSELPDLFLGGDVIQFRLLIEPCPVEDQQEVLVLFGITAGVPSGGPEQSELRFVDASIAVESDSSVELAAGFKATFDGTNRPLQVAIKQGSVVPGRWC